MASPLAPARGELTHRERAVLREYGELGSWKQVGHVLGISPRTAEWHAANACRKLGGIPVVRAVIYVRMAHSE